MNMLDQYYGITYTINILMGTSHTLSQYKIPNVANLQSKSDLQVKHVLYS